MTLEIALVLAILTVSVILLVSEIIPMEVTALLCLGAVAITGLVPAPEALSGFSNPAVVTIWAVFIVSGGLTRTGVANAIGNFVMRLAGTGEATIIIVIMTTAGLMSAIMNNVAVAALMLPVVMDIAHNTNRHPARLLMPLAYGCLLGGLTTQIGTPPNILVTEALDQAGLTPFSFFDFTPVGMLIMVVGTLFMAFIGRHFLPQTADQKLSTPKGSKDWLSQYALQERLFKTQLPEDSPLVGKSLAQIRLGSILGWNVVCISRGQTTIVAPKPDTILQAGDSLTVEGKLDALSEIRDWHKKLIPLPPMDLHDIYGDAVKLVAAQPADASFVGTTLNILNFRSRFELNVLGINRHGNLLRRGIADLLLEENDTLLLAGSEELLDALAEKYTWHNFVVLKPGDLAKRYHFPSQIHPLEIPPDCPLIGKSLKESRLSDALGSQIIGILRDSSTLILPEPGEILCQGDQMLAEEDKDSQIILEALEQLEVTPSHENALEQMMSGKYGLAEAILSPYSSLAGKTIRQINFREKFGLHVLAFWRRGKSQRTSLRDKKLGLGDSLLLLGSQSKLRLLGKEGDFIVLTDLAREEVHEEKMKISLAILCGVLAPVILGWVPIYIAMVVGAAVMILSGCLTMAEAYRQIEWKAVFLIAGMLPLGSALDSTGAAQYLASWMVQLVGPYGPVGIMFGLIAMTFMFTCFVPTAALVVLMAPIVFSTSASMNLSPHSLLMAVAMAASASFMTPVSHPANTLIMGPGGYKFSDYFKIGGLLTAVIFVVLMLSLPFFWPLNL